MWLPDRAGAGADMPTAPLDSSALATIGSSIGVFSRRPRSPPRPGRDCWECIEVAVRVTGTQTMAGVWPTALQSQRVSTTTSLQEPQRHVGTQADHLDGIPSGERSGLFTRGIFSMAQPSGPRKRARVGKQRGLTAVASERPCCRAPPACCGDRDSDPAPSRGCTWPSPREIFLQVLLA